MEYRRFGKTKIEMPVLSCGGMRFQQTWEDKGWEDIEAETQRNLEAVVRRAFELGINHFETAQGYGTSELQLGRILPALPREEIIVQTKGGVKDDIEAFERRLELSFERLGLEYIDLFAMHGMSNDMASFERGLRCLPVAEKFMRQGRIRHLGVAGHGGPDMHAKIIETGRFSYINHHYYFINQDNEPVPRMAEEADMGVFIISPNDKGGKLYDPPAKLRELTAPLSPMQFNDLFCLSHPGIHTISIGAAKPKDFDEHLAALDYLADADSLTAAAATKIEAEINRVMGDAWWGTFLDGLPSWENTPGKINIPMIIRLHTLAKALDMVDYAKMRYKLLREDNSWFPGSQAEEFDEDAILEAASDSPHAERIPAMLTEAHEMLKN